MHKLRINRSTAPLMMRNFIALRLFRDILLFLIIPFVFQISAFGQYKVATDASGSLVNQLMAISVFAGSLLLAKLSRMPLRTILFSMAPLAAVLLLALVSFFWSEFPSLTARRSLHLIIETISLVLVALAYRDKPEELLNRLFYIFAIITAANVASLSDPSMSFALNGFKGIHYNKNVAGAFFLCAIPLFALGITSSGISKVRPLAIFFLLLAIGLFFLTQSKTAWACVLIGIPLTLTCRLIIKSRGYGSAVLLLMCLAAGTGAVLLTLAVGTGDVLDKIFGDATLTGRPDIWRFALTKFDAEPLLGTGYGALWQTGADIEQYLSAYNVILINEAHNGYIDILAQLGVIGLLSLIIYLIVIFIRLCRTIIWYEDKNRIGIASYAMYLFIISVIYNITESSFFFTGISNWVMLVLISTCAVWSLAKPSAQIKKRQRITTRIKAIAVT